MVSTIRGDDNFDSAGPFGQTTLLVDRASVGTGSQVEVSFTGGYRRYEVYLEDVFPSEFNTSELRVRYKNTSNSIVSTSYAYHGIVDSDRQTISQSLGFYSEIRLSAYAPQGSSADGSNDLRFTFYDPYSTNASGLVTFNYAYANGTNSTEIGSGHAHMTYNNRQRFNGAVFYLTNGTFTRGNITVMGVSS